MKEETTLVAVWMVTYDHEKYIAQAIDSILSQKTDFFYKLYIGEDCSKDKTKEICEDYVKKNPKQIVLLESKENVGPNRNALRVYEACFKSGAKYIAMCEGDDYWTDAYKLQKQVDFLEEHQDCVSCHHWHEYACITKEGTYELMPAPTIGQGYLPKEKATVKEIFANKLRIKTRTHMFRNLLANLPNWYLSVAYGDVALSIILGKYGKFGFIDKPMAVYRKTNHGVSSLNKGQHYYYYNHFINWINIWEYGIQYYDYLYYEEAKGTLLYFYSFILKKYGFGIKVFFKLLFYAIFQSKIKISKRIGISLRLCIIFMINFLPSFLQRVKTKALRLTFRHA